MNFWHGMVNAFQSTAAVLIVAGGLAAILGILFYAMFGLKEKNTNWVIIGSTVLCCVLMVPVISSFNYLVKIKVEGTIIDEGRADIRAQRAEAARLLAENQARTLRIETLLQRITIGRQSVEMQTLNDSVKLLEHAQLSVQSFQKILELALLETNLKQTMVRKERIGGVDERYDEVLVIIIHDITVKYGIDLNDVRVAKLNETTVVVSGIRPIFIATPKNIPDDNRLSEIRRVEKINGVDTARVQKDSANMIRANKYADTFEAEFQERLRSGTELGFMNDAVIQLAQNFIKVMLAPLYRNIMFDNTNRADALPLMEHLGRDLRETNARILELDEINYNTIPSIEQLESVIEQMESSIPEDVEIEEPANDTADGDAVEVAL